MGELLAACSGDLTDGNLGVPGFCCDPAAAPGLCGNPIVWIGLCCSPVAGV